MKSGGGAYGKNCEKLSMQYLGVRASSNSIISASVCSGMGKKELVDGKTSFISKMSKRRAEFQDLRNIFTQQTEEFIKQKINQTLLYNHTCRQNQKLFQPVDDIDKLNDYLLYISFDDFKEWLNKYSFVRDMVREALMPKIWSLKDHNTNP